MVPFLSLFLYPLQYVMFGMVMKTTVMENEESHVHQTQKLLPLDRTMTSPLKLSLSYRSKYLGLWSEIWEWGEEHGNAREEKNRFFGLFS